MSTKITSTSVKVMQSYNYCHFEVAMSLENEEGLSTADIDEARKKCQRLTDKAVQQYKVAKDMAAKREGADYKKQSFENQCRAIAQKDEGDRTINEMAMLKQYQDESWQSQFDYSYDYDDDDSII
jgi:hypothetical protein